MFLSTKIPDVKIFEPRIFKDNRGYFYESYNAITFDKAGITAKFVQDNESQSSYGVLRGLHYQTGDYAQAKLVRVLEGKVLDIAVDIRKNSVTFGQWIGVELSAENKRQLFIPRGFAHGFLVLSKTATFFYKCDNFYSKSHEGGIRFDDPTLDIDWQIPPNNFIVSEKDIELPFLGQHKQ